MKDYLTTIQTGEVQAAEGIVADKEAELAKIENGEWKLRHTPWNN